METLQDSCHELEQVLAQVNDRCQAISTKLNEFEEYVASYAVGRLVRKLTILGAWIIAQAESLYKQHKTQGYVCVFLSEARGINILWVEREEIVADKAYFEAYGSKVLSVEEATEIIIDLLNELASGNWAKVVDWVKNYGMSPGLDFNKLS